MQRKYNILAIAIIVTSVGWFALPDSASVAVKETLGLAQSPAPVAIARTGKSLDDILSSWGADTRTVINGHAVPPMPDPKINNATIAGVDSDGDGIRDDIDRYIAEKWGNDPRYLDVVYQQQMQQRALIEQTSAARDRESDALACALPFKLADKDFQILAKRMSALTHQVLNTPARKGAYGMVMAGADLGTCPHRQ